MKQKAIDRTVENLKINGFGVKYFENSKAAVNALLDEIAPEKSVGFGGSMTIDELKIYEMLKERGNPVYWHFRLEKDLDRVSVLKQAASADIYLSSSNAITESGSLVNIDGTGNRLSAMLFGHEKVIIIAGVNKIARSLDEAFIRIKNVAAPLNTKRLKRDTPCAQVGKCMNCDVPDRVCRATLIIDRQPGGVPITIYLINEGLGY